MERIAIIGGGISGLSIAHCLKNKYKTTIFEKESRPGGMIRCERVDGHLYHTVGGHVFNTKRQDVSDWFWDFFSKEKEFIKADRNSVVSMEDGTLIPYPIENHAYCFKQKMLQDFIHDLVNIAKGEEQAPENFEEFLKFRFGKTLYENYFKPYNEKVWRRDLKKVPLTWLAGKLPMPTVEEMIYNNIHHVKETSFVHSSFYYPKNNGSQYLADKLAEKLDIVYNTTIRKIEKQSKNWIINGTVFDKVIFCGNIKDLPDILAGCIDICSYEKPIERLEYHGTTSVLCEIEKNPYSWIYMPARTHQSHRIICTGNFSESNNAPDKMSATIEFTDYISKEDILENLSKIPFSPRYITHKYTQYTYPIQNTETRDVLNQLKETLKVHNLYLLGRFAEWEYYNMDVAMGAAIDLSKEI